MKTVFTLALSDNQEQAAHDMLKLRSRVSWDIYPSVGGDGPCVVADQDHQSTCRNGRWRTLQRARHIVHVPNYGVISSTGRTITRYTWQPLTGMIERTRERVPDGYRVGRDNLGVYIKHEATGEDYHVSIGERWLPVTMWVNELELARDAREARKAKIAAELALRASFAQDNHRNTRVTMQDSRNAGNCAAGSMAFAQRLGYGQADVVPLNSPGIRGDVLMRTGETRAKEAVYEAWKRETTICI